MQVKNLSSILLLAILIQCFQSISSKLFSNFFNNQIHAKPSTIKEYSIYSLQSNPNNNFPDGDDNNNNNHWNSQNDFQTRLVDQERDQLYEAYNLLHTLAQDFHKPFDSPAVIVVGHQTSGKSALIEALMGFQFNQVGGGTKTRRPIALRMQYNPNCATPMCFLTLENGKEEQRTLTDIQAYIEAENKRLEKDPTRSFDPREINIRMEYRYCPNMIVIDTPGMIHPPKGRQLTPQQRALAQASREAENLVLSKIRCQDYIILCVEDTTDWKHATTRNIVMQADPQLARTVLVTTKLDTKLPQFSEPLDIEDFLKAPLIQTLFSQMLGGPFFTTVPSGRVGTSRDYDSNDAFVQFLHKSEQADYGFIVQKLGMTKAKSFLARVGVSKLRAFLEARVEDCYRRNVAKIVPLLQSELRHTEEKLAITEKELQSLSIERLKQAANSYREQFAKELSLLIQGTVRANPDDFGETLEMEQVKGGSFLQYSRNAVGSSSSSSSQNIPSTPLTRDTWQQIIAQEVGNQMHKLYGGAQYHRTMREFTIAVRHMNTPSVSEDEIANAAGMGDVHNGVNFMRAACIIAMEKAQISFEPMLESLRLRAEHVMKRMFPIIEHLVRQRSHLYTSPSSSRPSDYFARSFSNTIRTIFDQFVDKKVQECLDKCRDDLHAMTRYVTWDVEDKGGSSSLYRLLPTPQKMVEIYNVAVERKNKELKDHDRQSNNNNNNNNNRSSRGSKNSKDSKSSPADKVISEWKQANGEKDSQQQRQELSLAASPIQHIEDDAVLSDYYKVMQLTEEMVSGSSASRTSSLVTSLVQYIISSWRNHFAHTTSNKFNCFFLLPFMDEFPEYLRNELDRVYQINADEMFDIGETRRSLLSQRAELLAECTANHKLQKRFDQIAQQIKLNVGPTSSSSSSSASSSTQSFNNSPSKPSSSSD